MKTKHKRLLCFLYSLSFVAPLLAQNSDPNCLNVPTESELKAWQLPSDFTEALRGAAPNDPEIQKLKTASEINQEAVIPLNTFSLFGAANHYSDLIYLAPDLETSESPEAFIAGFSQFYKKIPRTHELYHVMSDPLNGLKYAIFKPVAGSDFKLWILSIAGTQTFLDKIVDGTMGRHQFERLTQLFTKCLFQDAQGQPLLLPLSFMGHSLGGGLAQALYHQVQGRLTDLTKRGIKSPLSLVTLNAFGGQELLEQVQVPFNEKLIQTDRVANYFIRGDVVSKIGTHIGPSFEMIPIDEQGREKDLGLGAAHALTSFLEIVKTSALFKLPFPTTPTAPKRSFTINKFYDSQKDKALGLALFLYPRGSYLLRSAKGEIAKFIQASAQTASRAQMQNAERTALYNYIQVLAADEEFRLRKRISITGSSDRLANELRASVDASIGK